VTIVAFGLLGLAAAGTVGTLLPWQWHLALGSFAFALAFIATDPTTQPRTSAGRCAFGMLFGAMTVVLRTGNPEHPEATMFALLLASLCIPALDRISMLWRVWAGGARS
jgi:Na+-transporting NADH:ubiquinone oxidoreductase subunit B